MKIPWNLVLRKKDLQDKLNERLYVLQKPFLWCIIWAAPPLNILMWMGIIKKKTYLDPDKLIRDLCYSGIAMLTMLAAAIGLKRPKWLAIGALIMRSFISILLCCVQYKLFEGR